MTIKTWESQTAPTTTVGQQLVLMQTEINALRAAIKEVELAEPSAWLDGDEIITFGNMRHGFIDRRDRAIPDSWKPLYLAPPATQQAHGIKEIPNV